jgi:hypothetical protein
MCRMFATAPPNSGQLFHESTAIKDHCSRFLPHCCQYATAECDGDAIFEGYNSAMVPILIILKLPQVASINV